MQLIIKVLSVVAGASLLAVVVSGAKEMKPIFEIQRERNDKPKLGPRIVGGVAASPNEFPFVVLIDITEISLAVIGIDLFSQYYASCGGSIITRRAILTAGHCVIPDRQDILGLVTLLGYSYRIRGGSVNVNSFTFDVTTEVAFQHPNYNAKTYEYDMGIIALPENLAFDTPNVQPLTLVYGTNYMYDGLYIIVVGFGVTSPTSTTMSTTLQKTGLSVISTAVCQTSYTDPIPSTSFCAEGDVDPKSSICPGDSGGPALVIVTGVYFGVGISAYARDDGCNLGPSGFTKTVEFTGWIFDTVHDNDLN